MALKDDSELKLLIINTIAMRFSEIESIEYLKGNGYDLSVRYLRKLKKEIRDNRQDRLDSIAKSGFIDAHLEAIDNLNHIKKEMWLQYLVEKSPYKKVEILTQIANLEPYISEYYAQTKKVMENKEFRSYQEKDITS